jgi:hypothetical protein
VANVLTSTFTRRSESEIGVERIAVVDLDAVQSSNNIFAIAKLIEFEDGMGNEFRGCLFSFIQKYGSLAIEILEKRLRSKDTDPDVVSMTLRYLGEIEHPATYRHRLTILIHALTHPSPKVRDGATLGLASIDQPIAIPYLENAIKQERISELRKDMEQVLQQLRESK